MWNIFRPIIKHKRLAPNKPVYQCKLDELNDPFSFLRVSEYQWTTRTRVSVSSEPEPSTQGWETRPTNVVIVEETTDDENEQCSAVQCGLLLLVESVMCRTCLSPAETAAAYYSTSCMGVNTVWLCYDWAFHLWLLLFLIVKTVKAVQCRIGHFHLYFWLTFEVEQFSFQEKFLT